MALLGHNQAINRGERGATAWFEAAERRDWTFAVSDETLALPELAGGGWRRDAALDVAKNGYRVLLTRARKGMVIFVPDGDRDRVDATRDPDRYDAIAECLMESGARALPGEIVSDAGYPPMIAALPEVDLPLAGVVGKLLQAGDKQVVFFEIGTGGRPDRTPRSRRPRRHPFHRRRPGGRRRAARARIRARATITP